MTVLTTAISREQIQPSKHCSQSFIHRGSFMPMVIPISQMRKPGTENWNQSDTGLALVKEMCPLHRSQSSENRRTPLHTH